MLALQGRFLAVRKIFLVAVSFVRRGDDDLLHERTAATSFEKKPGPADIGFKRGKRISIRDPDDGLGGEMNDGANFVLAESSLDQPLFAKIAANDLNFRVQTAADELGLRNPVTHQAGDLRAGG